MNSDNYKQEQPLVKPYTNISENRSDVMQKSHMSKQKKWIYYIEERRREVTQMLAQGHSERDSSIAACTCKYHLQRRQGIEGAISKICI